MNRISEPKSLRSDYKQKSTRNLSKLNTQMSSFKTNKLPSFKVPTKSGVDNYTSEYVSYISLMRIAKATNDE